MTERRVFLAIIAAGLLPLPLSGARGQPAARTPRIGVVSPASPRPAHPPQIVAFQQALRELGYVEGQNVVVELRFAEGRPERFPELLAEVLRLKVDVLVVGSTLGALSAKRSAPTVPIVFAGLIDPVPDGIVTNLARPGGNITGATFGVGGAGFAGKWLELLAQTVADLSHVSVLSNSANPQTTASVGEIRVAAQALNVRLDDLDAGTATKLDQATATIVTSGTGGLIVTADPFFFTNRMKLVRFAASRRLPAVYFVKDFVEAGGLMAYGGSLADSYRRAAGLVDRILRGARPGDLPVEQPTRFELSINLRTARALGLTVPPSLLARADEVIE
jgi:putative ABC transport system substrate-binding protein